MTSTTGGNELKTLDLKKFGKQIFCEEAHSYTYYFCRNQAGQIHKEAQLSSFTLYVLPTIASGFVKVIETGDKVFPGEALISEGTPLSFEVVGDTLSFLISGTNKHLGLGASVKKLTQDQIKKVVKPWGYELWINGEHPGYALKDIRINKGTKTSLQYHRFKRETNVLLDGDARLYFKNNASIENDLVQNAHLGSIDVKPVTSIDVTPNIIHRIEALSDIHLCETSTPHLDDVVRLMDDAQRSSGRIQSEHASRLS